MSDGQLAMNTNSASPGLFLKDSSGALVKVGPVHVGTTAPNASPASGGQSGNTVGEQWLDISGSTFVFKIWDGSAWRSEAGEFVNVTGDVMTGALGIIAGSAGSPGLYFSGDTNTGLYSPGADQVAISTNGSQRLLIDSTGQIEAAGLGSASAPAWSYVGDPNTGIFSPTADTLAITTGGSERLRVDSSGRLGLGTSSPSQVLTTVGNIKIAGAQNSNVGNIFLTRTDRSWGIYNETDLRFKNSAGDTDSPSTTAMVITAAGNVGIGVTDPGSYYPEWNQLVVGNNSASRGITIVSGSSYQGTLAFADGTSLTDRYRGYIQYDHVSDSIYVGTAATERFRCDSSGRLLVGTSTARTTSTVNWLSQIEGLAVTGLGITTNNNNVDGAYLSLAKSRGTSVGSNTIVQSNDGLGYILFSGADGTDANTQAALIGCEVDGTPGANDMPGRLVFSTTADGASSPTEQLRITSDRYVRLASGTGGIQFGGDTAAANALDDYEEGTFTPTIVGTSTAGTATYAANGQVGRYTKIGNRVFFDLYLSWTAHTGTGDLQINGLPFTVQNTTNLNRNYSAILNVVAMTAGNLGAAFSSPNTTAVALRQMPTGGGSVATIPMDTSAQISISGCFEA
jgi:hypothetical protein